MLRNIRKVKIIESKNLENLQRNVSVWGISKCRNYFKKLVDMQDTDNLSAIILKKDICCR